MLLKFYLYGFAMSTLLSMKTAVPAAAEKEHTPQSAKFGNRELKLSSMGNLSFDEYVASSSVTQFF